MKNNFKIVIDKSKKYYLSYLVVPLLVILVMSILLLTIPDKMFVGISAIDNFLRNDVGFYYLLVGLLFVIVALIMAFSKIGNVKLGDEKPIPLLSWGAMIFTSTMAADILYYALHEWSIYIADPNLSTAQSNAYPFFHWGVTPWSFYIVLAVCYAFMFFVIKVNNQRISEACRPLLGKYTDKLPGKLIDIISIIGLLLGTSTTFSVATPLIAQSLWKLFNMSGVAPTWVVFLVLLVVAAMYTIPVMGGLKSINKLSKIGVIVVSIFLAGFFILGGPSYIVNYGISGIGTMVDNFFSMSTGAVSTEQYSGTVFYWAYWIAWAVATPLFIAKISKGRTIRQLVVGGLISGLLGTYTSFVILGGGSQNIGSHISPEGLTISQYIVEVIFKVGNGSIAGYVLLVLLVISMMALYATTFDGIAYVMSGYMTRNLMLDEEPSKVSKVLWSFILLVLPAGLIWSETTITGLQTMSVIGALPLSVIFILVIISFFKSYKIYKNSKLVTQEIINKEVTEIQ